MYTEDGLKERLERGFLVGPSTNSSRSVTGEPYVVIGPQHLEEGLPLIPGTIDEGKRSEWGYDEETAFCAIVNSFELYAEGRGKNLYWRSGPILDWDDNHTRCKFYVRLLVSDKS